MSTLPENELDLDKLFLPAWAQEPSSSARYAHFEGGQERSERRGEHRGNRPPRRETPRQHGQDERRPRGDRGDRGERGDRRRPPRRGSRDFDGDRSGGRVAEGRAPRERRGPPQPLPEIDVSFIPDERGVESLARQIKTTGRAYPLFEIARLILQKPERYAITFAVKRKPDGQVAQQLFICALDDTTWLSEDEAISHVLRNHFGTFYQTDRTPAEPPKGKYTFVAQCGMSGAVLGPPNYHDYQNQLRKLHSERFSRMPFEAFKARVKIVRDEEVVKKWIEEQSWKTEYACLNVPDALRLGSRDAVEKHFRETHKDAIIKPVEKHSMSGVAARNLRSAGLSRLVRQAWDDQKHFPLQIATILSQQFAAHGLQFFKVNRAITHVSVARPHFLDLERTPVSDGVKRIVDFISAHSRCTRRKLLDALAPAPIVPKPVVLPVAPSEPAAPPAAPAETAAAAPAEPSAVASAPPPAAPVTPVLPEPTPEQTAVNADLHWLIHQGHVIEFANGILETAKKPAPKPPKPESKQPQPAQPAAGLPAGPTAEATTASGPADNVPMEAVVETAEVATSSVEDGSPPPGALDEGEPAPPTPAAEPQQPV